MRRVVAHLALGVSLLGAVSCSPAGPVATGPATFKPLTEDDRARWAAFVTPQFASFTEIAERHDGTLVVLRKPCAKGKRAADPTASPCTLGLTSLAADGTSRDYPRIVGSKVEATGVYESVMPNLVVDGELCGYRELRPDSAWQEAGYASDAIEEELGGPARPLVGVRARPVPILYASAYGFADDGTIRGDPSLENRPSTKVRLTTASVALGGYQVAVVSNAIDPDHAPNVITVGDPAFTGRRIFAAVGRVGIMPPRHHGMPDLGLARGKTARWLYRFDGTVYRLAPCQTPPE